VLRSRAARRAVAAALLALLTAPPAAAQGDPRGGTPGGPPAPQASREATWPAPTSGDWARPCLIPFQRSWEDALALARESRRLILVCVNMDGEIASEHYAGIAYRDPDTAVFYQPYVCVIASVFRHTPRDYDDLGRRVPCPRFGSVTCGEHIALEPLVYERFLDGRRIAPRHIAVDPEAGGSELFDVFYRYDTASVFEDIARTAATRPPGAPLVHGDLPVEERVASREARDRAAVERAYLEGDRVARRRLLEGALAHRELDAIDLLRLALFGLDVELARLARAALARSESPKAVELIAEVLGTPLEPAEREALLAALERLGEGDPRARLLAVVQRGLTRPSDAVDTARWSAGLAGAVAPRPLPWRETEARIERRWRESAATPRDAETQLGLAEAALALAVDPETARILAADPKTAGAYHALQMEDARRAALAAQRLGASGWRVEAVLALTAHYLGEREEAASRAERVVRTLPAGETGWNAMAVVGLFAERRREDLLTAAREGRPWPPAWLADVEAAYTVLEAHPLGTEAQVLAHVDFARELGLRPRAAEVLEKGLARFPRSWALHDRLRRHSLEDAGVEGLEAAYAWRLQADPRPEAVFWFAGYAALVTAEHHRRAGNPAAALAAYARALWDYDESVRLEPETRASSDHYAALALAGRARVLLEQGDLARAVDELLASFARRPEAAATLDGLTLTAVDTARMLLARLEAGGDGAAAQRVRAGLEALDPALLALPAYEREVPPPPDPQGGGSY